MELSQWLREKCKKEKLTLREMAARTGLSHSTIRDIINNNVASAESIKKLARAFTVGENERLALEDRLLVLAGHRSERPGEELSPSMARLMDFMAGFNDPQLKIMERFANFLIEIDGGDSNGS
ncbi:hypothetical protein ES703_120819 [subsurface metagenome]